MQWKICLWMVSSPSSMGLHQLEEFSSNRKLSNCISCLQMCHCKICLATDQSIPWPPMTFIAICPSAQNPYDVRRSLVDCKKLFIVHLTEREYLAVPRNLKLLAVSLFELYDNIQDLLMLGACVSLQFL